MPRSAPPSLLALLRRLADLSRRAAASRAAPAPAATPDTTPMTGAKPTPAPAPSPLPQPAREADFPFLDSVSPVSHRHKPERIGAGGLALIKRFEGCAKVRRDGLIEAYPDPGTGAEPWTIGWGATGHDHVHGGRIGPGTRWTQAQCDERLARDLVRYAADVRRAIGDAPTSQAQFDAMVSFHYNTGAIGRATLTRRHVAGDSDGACREFARWNRAGGRVMKGLVRRRAAEAALYADAGQ